MYTTTSWRKTLKLLKASSIAIIMSLQLTTLVYAAPEDTTVQLNLIEQSGADLIFAFDYEHIYELDAGLQNFDIEYSADGDTWAEFVDVFMGLPGSSDISGNAGGSFVGITVLDGFYRVRVKNEIAGDVYSNEYQYPVPEIIDPELYVAEYWNSAGGVSPVFDFLAPPDFEQNNVDMSNINWDIESPNAAIHVDGFIGRFTKTDTFSGRDVVFSMDTDDGIRVKIDGDVVVDHWINGYIGTETVPVSAGTHTVVVEYYEDTEIAHIQFRYNETLDGTGTALDPYQIIECVTITEPGYYELQNTITDITGDCIRIESDDVFLDGAGYSLIALAAEGDQGVQVLQGYDRVDISDITIDGFFDGIMVYNHTGPSRISGVTITNTIDDGIDLHGVVDMTITTSEIIGTQDDGIEINAFETEDEEIILSGDITIDNVSITEVESNGIEIEGVQGIHISESTFSDIVDNSAIYISGADDSYLDTYVYSTDVVIDTLTITQVGYEETEGNDASIYISDTHGISIESSDITQVYAGIEIYGGSDIRIENISITDTQSRGILVEDYENLSITDNTLTHIQADALFIRVGNSATISDNTMDDILADGIDISSDEEDGQNRDVVVTRNTMTNIQDNGIEINELVGGTIEDNMLQVSGSGMDIQDTQGITVSGNTINPMPVEYLLIPETETESMVLSIDDAENSISTDDASFTYALPFVFEFMGRDIVEIEISSNGSIELLENAETCELCSDYGNIAEHLIADSLFASFDDLHMGTIPDHYVAVFNHDDEYITVEWFGETFADANDDEYFPIHFQVALYPNGEVQWNFIDMSFNEYGNTMFTGAYDVEADVLYSNNVVVSEPSSYRADLSGEGTFDVFNGNAMIIGMDLDFISDSTFTGNHIRAEQWVIAEDLSDVQFNTSNSGNSYFFTNGNPASSIFDITDSNGNGFADAGSDRPFNEHTLGVEYWSGEGEDRYPATLLQSNRAQSSDRSTKLSRERAKRMWNSYYEKQEIHTPQDTDPVKKEAVKESDSTAPTQVVVGTLCPADTTMTQNIKAPSRNGVYHPYTRGIVTDAKKLQMHLNRLGFNAGPEDGILGPLSIGAIQRMQTSLNTIPDGYVGPITRNLLNTSC